MAILLEDLFDLLANQPLPDVSVDPLAICAAPPLNLAAAQAHFASRFADLERIDLLAPPQVQGRMQTCQVELTAEVTARLRQRAKAAGSGHFCCAAICLGVDPGAMDGARGCHLWLDAGGP